jgi:hypothetical protein
MCTAPQNAVCESAALIRAPVRDGDHRAVPDDLAEVVTPQQPGRGVLGVVVALVAGEEQQIGVLFLQLGNDCVTVAARAGERRFRGAEQHYGRQTYQPSQNFMSITLPM